MYCSSGWPTSSNLFSGFHSRESFVRLHQVRESFAFPWSTLTEGIVIIFIADVPPRPLSSSSFVNGSLYLSVSSKGLWSIISVKYLFLTLFSLLLFSHCVAWYIHVTANNHANSRFCKLNLNNEQFFQLLHVTTNIILLFYIFLQVACVLCIFSVSKFSSTNKLLLS